MLNVATVTVRGFVDCPVATDSAATTAATSRETATRRRAMRGALTGAAAVCNTQPHQRAATGGGLGADAPAVRLGDLAHDRETEAGARHAARGRRPVEPLEDVRQVGVGDPRPAVAHRQLAVR